MLMEWVLELMVVGRMGVCCSCIGRVVGVVMIVLGIVLFFFWFGCGGGWVIGWFCGGVVCLCVVGFGDVVWIVVEYEVEVVEFGIGGCDFC